MYDAYLQDTHHFLCLARGAKPDVDLQKRYYRAAVFCACGSIEAFVNFIGSVLEAGSGDPSYEVAFLTDRKFSPAGGRFRIEEQLEMHRLEDKLKHLVSRAQPAYDFSANQSWSAFHELKDLRDNITHPKEDSDPTTCEVYDTLLSRGLPAIIDLLNIVSKHMFKKKLRRGLLALAMFS